MRTNRRTYNASNRPVVGLCELFKVGIGPSSSHTMGPMIAAKRFIGGLKPGLEFIRRLRISVYGSLAWTGKGHWTDRAIILGLAGCSPETLTPELGRRHLDLIAATGAIELGRGHRVGFDANRDIDFDKAKKFTRHPNAMMFEAFASSGRTYKSELWYSVGGGFVELEGAENSNSTIISPRFSIADAEGLLSLCRTNGLSIADIAGANEDCYRERSKTYEIIRYYADTMFECIERGLAAEGELPGSLKVKRRARSLFMKSLREPQQSSPAPDSVTTIVPAFAMAVNEENASGHRVVTAPTNGAAGVIPAVLRYYRDFCEGADQGGINKFFLTATIIGAIIKRNASISGAEVGCQGEVGSAAAMAAAGLCAALGGSNEQVEKAAEIAIEHHLERNAFGAVKAITAATIALQEDGSHRVSLDEVIEAMRQTGADMKSKYRETSRGGLAINVAEC
ncbi:MAG: L-serine ammonia-lyase [Alphaproteobacteria bacterium]|nr:L-serine ammonia-lyase [Alphaproteobacteria bacterium]